MTDHTVFEERICAMLDGELSDGEAAELRAHLDECPECRAFLDAMKAVYGLSAKELPEAPPELSKNVMERVRTEAGAAADHPRGRVIRFPFRSLAAAAAAALVLWAGARSLPAFRAKSAAPQAAAAGLAQESAVVSAEETRRLRRKKGSPPPGRSPPSRSTARRFCGTVSRSLSVSLRMSSAAPGTIPTAWSWRLRSRTPKRKAPSALCSAR